MTTFPTAEGLLYVKGSLSLSGDSKKWNPYWFHVSDGLLTYYHLDKTIQMKKKKEENKDKENDKLIDLVPLTYGLLEEVSKKDKKIIGQLDEGSKKDMPKTVHVCVLTSVNNKKWRTVFSTETSQELETWKKALQDNIMLARVSVFDTTITDACLKANKYLPAIMEESVRYTEQNLKVEGLFRVPGDKSQISLTKEQFDKGVSFIFEKVDPHLVCGVMKSYLRDISDPLIPQQLYKPFVNAQSVQEIKELILQLPETNRCCICYLMNFLGRVEQESASNLMDVSNLATVFGPTIIRNINEDNIKSMNLEETAQANQIIKILIENRNLLFTPEDLAKSKMPIVDVSAKMAETRVAMTSGERVAIEAVITPHHKTKIGPSESVWDSTISFLVNTRISKSHDLEPKIFVADHNRLYVFQRGGKPEYEFHLIELTEIDSPNKFQVTLTWQTTVVDSNGKAVPSGKPMQLIVHPISYASFDIDIIIEWVHKQWVQNFVGKPQSEKFFLILEPPDRKEQILSRFKLEDKEAGCGGLVRTYISVCDWMTTEVKEDVIWDLENYFYPNSLKSFNLYDLIPKDKWPCEEFQSIIFSLHHNLWFKSLDCEGCPLGNESVVMISEMMRHNTTIERLSLKDAGASHRAVTALCEAFDSNKENLALTYLNLSGNTMDQKTVAVLSNSIMDSLRLVELDISNAKIAKMGPIFEALGKTPSIVNGLVKLNVSQNKLDVMSSRMVGTFLMLTRSLEHLNISGTTPTWLNIVESMMDKSGLIRNKTVTTLDVSHNPSKGKGQAELVQFLQNMPALQVLTAADTQLTADSLVQLLNTNRSISELDVSENDLPDEGVILFMKALYTPPTAPVMIKKLYMNRTLKSRSKVRLKAMKCTAKALNKVDIKEFYINNCKLKADIMDFIFGLFNNKNLEVLDISGNQSGDQLAVALSKLFQHNRTVHTVFWDNNEISLSGLKSILLGLQRNRCVKHMPLPLLDIAAILKKENVDAEAVVEVTKKIQREVYEKGQLTFKNDVESGIGGGVAGVEVVVSLPVTHASWLNKSQRSLSATSEELLVPIEKALTTKSNSMASLSSKVPIVERRQPKTISKRKKSHLQTVDITRAQMVFGSLHEGSVTEEEEFQNNSEGTVPHPEDTETDSHMVGDKKDTPENSENSGIPLSEDPGTGDSEKQNRKTPLKERSLSRQHIAKRKKKKTTRGRPGLTSAASLGTLPQPHLVAINGSGELDLHEGEKPATERRVRSDVLSSKE